MTWQGAYIQNIKEFKSAKRILEIGAGNFSTAIYLAVRNPSKEIYAIDFTLSEQAIQNLKNIPQNLFIIKADAVELSFLNQDFFDFIFSIAVGEHIYDMDKHLIEMYRLLKFGCTYFFWAAPIWSCSIGHHLHWHTTFNKVIPPYAHLYMSEDTMSAFLVSQGIQPKFAIEKIYHRRDLSRLKYSDYIKILNSSPFLSVRIENEYDSNYDQELYKNVKENNIFDVNEDEAKIKGIKVFCTK